MEREIKKSRTLTVTVIEYTDGSGATDVQAPGFNNFEVIGIGKFLQVSSVDNIFAEKPTDIPE